MQPPRDAGKVRGRVRVRHHREEKAMLGHRGTHIESGKSQLDHGSMVDTPMNERPL
ncbi:hypothetical protein [Burkholderia latens]|uniref:hypothetical protein n=1 Tax=Burkholderia latens TaxID=488446 RepID=UPI0014790F20|nr:hypothetical protein [Burkholderia latens]